MKVIEELAIIYNLCARKSTTQGDITGSGFEAFNDSKVRSWLVLLTPKQ